MQGTAFLTLNNLVLHGLTHLHVFRCFYCVITDSVQEQRFLLERPRFRAFNVVLAEKKTRLNAKKSLFATLQIFLPNSQYYSLISVS